MSAAAASPASTSTSAPAPGDQPAAAAPGDQPAAAPAEPAGGQGAGAGEGAEGSPAQEAPGESADLDGSKGGTDPSGGESDRHEYRRAAQHLFGGDRVGGDKFVFYLASGEQGPPLQRLAPTLEELARHAFVPPAGWDRYRLDFHDRHTVMLRGAPGHGRVTMAIRLLQTVEAGPIFELDRRTDLTRMAERLTAQRLERGTAFLLHQPEEVSRLDAYTFRSLEEALTTAGARLVVTVGNEVSFYDEELLRYQVDLPGTPEWHTILTEHLRYRLDEDRAGRILDQPEVAELVAEQLAGDEVTCERTAFLAWLLSRATDPIDVEEIAKLLQRRSTDEFEIWFESLETVSVRCFAVALAVLDGLPYEEVADAARRLHKRLSSGGKLVLVEDAGLKVAGSDPFRLSQTRLLELLQARREQATVRTPYGDVPVTKVAYRDPRYPQQVIERVWNCYQAEEKLLAWLDELVTTGSSQVRVYAATALGVLATGAFEYLRRRVLTPWAHHEHLWKNQAVADALGVAAIDPGLQGEVTRLVDAWYGSDNADAQCTAALALGTRLGRPDATQSIRALERLSTVNHSSVRVGIARGFTALLAERPTDELDSAAALALETYRVVGSCLADGDRAFTGQYVFLFIAADLQTDPSAGDATARWPALLYLAREYEQLRAPLFECWASALTEGPALAMAQRVLRVWAGCAEADSAVRETFTRMVRAVALLDTRAGAVLARAAKQWNSDEELLPLPEVARAVSSVVPN